MMKKLFWLGTFLLSVIVLSSCNDDDGYSLGNYAITVGTFHETGDYFYIETDGGSKLWPSASEISADKHDEGDRIFVNFTILGDAPADESYDYYVKVNATSSILTKPIFNFTEDTSQEVKDSIGDDPVSIIDTWFKDDYLNIEFAYGGGYTMHYINLVKDSTDLETENGEVILELKHNKNDDPYNYEQRSIASFDISELKKDGQDKVDIFLRSKNSNGDYSYNKVLTYDYSNESSVEQPVITNKEFTDSDVADAITIE